MSEQTTAVVPRSFWIIASLALVWDLLGVVNYVMYVTISEEALADLPEAQRALRDSLPAWFTSAFALAVNLGVLGSLLLLLRKVWALPVLALSLAFVLAQMGYSTFMTDAAQVLGAGAVAMNAVITAVAIFLVWYSLQAKNRGWIS